MPLSAATASFIFHLFFDTRSRDVGAPKKIGHERTYFKPVFTQQLLTQLARERSGGHYFNSGSEQSQQGQARVSGAVGPTGLDPTVCLRPPPASRSSQMRNVHSVRSASAGVDRCAGGERLAELDAARHDVGGDVEVREAPLKLAEALSRGG